MSKKIAITIFSIVLLVAMIVGCQKATIETTADPYASIVRQFGTSIDPYNLFNYAGQSKPTYITRDNTGNNPIQNAKATLGRVLFYDKALSIDRSIACGSCHQQKFAFSDTSLVSAGVEDGKTTRHSMRLVNSRFAEEVRFFWNKRAANLESQSTMPIRDHAEMGFSGENGRPGMPELLERLNSTDYYRAFFQLAYGDPSVTEVRMQECLAQFIRSIQSFDSKYDIGRAQVTQDTLNFPNFTVQENRGKGLFLSRPIFDGTGNRIGGGLGCGQCHRAPEFDIDPRTLNNGIVGIIQSPGLDLNNTKSPTLRELVRADGSTNGPMMHTGVIKTLQAAIGHYGAIVQAQGNNNLDPRLIPNGFPQRLNLNAQDVNAVIAFLKTLTGQAMYTAPQWSDPF